MMIFYLRRSLFLIPFCACLLFCSTKGDAGEPLKVFILAGQSNTVGHARAHTIATLLASDQAGACGNGLRFEQRPDA
jgi:hypothetical protein